ncbi:MAG: electron transfer flavoprotein subunit alpha/FixB family protein [Bacillaceae bacterium]|nr:electron transfer flavoprotein subunit alpha/FixB family protein [Bacillaceae bacterium]
MTEQTQRRRRKNPAVDGPLAVYRGVWVYIEVNEGVIAPVSLELLGEGRKLADKLEVDLAGVLIGDHVRHLAKQVFEYGADLCYLAEDPIFEKYRSETYMKVVVDLCEKYKPEIFLYGATPTGKDLASAVATDLKTGLTADTTILDVDVETRLLEASRPAFGGNIMATILCKNHRPQMATVRPKVMQAMEPDPERDGKIIEETFDIREDDLKTRVLEIVKNVKRTVKMEEADIIVAGGKGLKDEKGFELVHRLAETLGATVGASRDAVEAGWIGHEHQVGQTGVTVTPKIYFAIGISGAIQHLVGMQNSRMIIAINNDPDAPIFQAAHYGIVGDAFEIVPRLIEAFDRALHGEEVVEVG